LLRTIRHSAMPIHGSCCRNRLARRSDPCPPAHRPRRCRMSCRLVLDGVVESLDDIVLDVLVARMSVHDCLASGIAVFGIGKAQHFHLDARGPRYDGWVGNCFGPNLSKNSNLKQRNPVIARRNSLRFRRAGSGILRKRVSRRSCISSPAEVKRRALPWHRWHWPVPSCRGRPGSLSCSRCKSMRSASAQRSSSDRCWCCQGR
jgi:hypothetical protein